MVWKMDCIIYGNERGLMDRWPQFGQSDAVLWLGVRGCVTRALGGFPTFFYLMLICSKPSWLSFQWVDELRQPRTQPILNDRSAIWKPAPLNSGVPAPTSLPGGLFLCLAALFASRFVVNFFVAAKFPSTQQFLHEHTSEACSDASLKRQDQRFVISSEKPSWPFGYQST